MANNDYREEMREIRREATWTIWQWLPTVIIVLVLLAVIGWMLQSAGIISMNIKRETVQHSQQYTETKGSLLQKLYTDYLQLDAEIAELGQADGSQAIITAKKSQQKAIVIRMRSEADLIPQSQVPSNVSAFLAKHG